jgi:hypothetical protein
MRKPKSKPAARPLSATPATSNRTDVKAKPNCKRGKGSRMIGSDLLKDWKCPSLSFDCGSFPDLRETFAKPPEYWERLRAENARFEKIILALFDAVRKPGMSDYQLALAAVKEIKRRKAAGDPDWISTNEEKPGGRRRRKVVK